MENSIEESEIFEGLVNEVIDEAARVMEKKYGMGGENPKEYHNITHVLQAVQAVEEIARLSGETAKMIGLLKVAMACHDLETDCGNGNNEEISADMAAEIMTKKAFSENDINLVREMILATRFSFDENGVMNQLVGEDENSELGRLKRMAADADLSSLGRPWDQYSVSAQALGREMGKISKNETPEEMINFWGYQANFLEKFSSRGYYTQAAKKLLGEVNSNLEKSRSLARQQD